MEIRGKWVIISIGTYRFILEFSGSSENRMEFGRGSGQENRAEADETKRDKYELIKCILLG